MYFSKSLIKQENEVLLEQEEVLFFDYLVQLWRKVIIKKYG